MLVGYRHFACPVKSLLKLVQDVTYKTLLDRSQMQDSRNYYEILEVSRKATPQEIKKAYRRLARQYHPDLHPENPTSAERFQVIYQAYQVLSDPVQRRQYDHDQGFDGNRRQPKSAPMTAQDFYVRAVAKALARNYQGAIKDCNQAIELNPDFVEAYVERGASRYKLGNARGALQDCNQALSLNPNLAQAYYYQGRARYRLGYTQAAIEAYNQAIAKAPDQPKTYYHRGLANQDLKEHDQAVEDLQKAAALFQEQDDGTGYQLVQETLRMLNQTQGKQRVLSQMNPIPGVKALLGDVWKAFQSFAPNPAGGLLPAFANLDQQRAILVGMVFAGIFNLCFVGGMYLGWQDFLDLSPFRLILVGTVPFVTLAALSAIARLIVRRPGSLAGDIFLAGASLIPLSFLILLSGISTLLGNVIMIILTVFAVCYTILTLYSGCTQIANLSETSAALLVPVMVMVSGWFFYAALTTMLP